MKKLFLDHSAIINVNRQNTYTFFATIRVFLKITVSPGLIFAVLSHHLI